MGGAEVIYSNSSTSEGISTSICSNVTLAYKYGVSGSRCRGQDNSITHSTGVVFGTGAKYSEQICVQETKCF